MSQDQPDMHKHNFPWPHQRRFNAYVEHIRSKFGERIQKVTINAGFTCPNRDGTTGRGGCTYCNNNAFNPSYCTPEKSVEQQIEEGIEFHRLRYRRSSKYMAYFQAYTNTYEPLHQLKIKYEAALSHPDVVGIIIGTRPDCINTELLAYLAGLQEKSYVQVEYGIESCYNETLEKINRGHSFEKSKWAIEETAKAGIPVGGHLIFGLPGESRQKMMAQAQILSSLPLSILKFHQLQIVKDTAMAVDYAKNPGNYKLFEQNEYIDFIIQFIENLSPAIMIERIASEAPPRFNKGISWGKRVFEILTLFEKELEARNTWQGKYYEEKSKLHEDKFIS